MNKAHGSKAYESAILTLLREGGVSVPGLLLRHYRRLGLSDMEAMLLIQLIAFQEKEHTEFPTIEEIQSRMSAEADDVIRALQRLLKERFLDIDEYVVPSTGIQAERYNLNPLWVKLSALLLKDAAGQEAEDAPTRPLAAGGAMAAAAANRSADAGKSGEEGPATDVFSMFEQEFARPLTPMEFETIANWLDRDHYPLELIALALREAVFAGRLRFNYIDRILLEWSRNRVFTPEQAKAYSQKFRGR